MMLLLVGFLVIVFSWLLELVSTWHFGVMKLFLVDWLPHLGVMSLLSWLIGFRFLLL